jgi:hypothetical protein
MHVVMRTLLPKKETEAATKKRKTDSGKKRAASEIDRVDATSEDNDTSNKPAAKGTTTAHFIKFIKEIFDIMDIDESMKGNYRVIDNASIH